MDQPLGRAVGNFLEVEESIDCLRGKGPADVVELTCRLAGWMLVLGEKAANPAEGQLMAAKKLSDGSAWDLFLKNVEFQGGQTEFLLHPEKGPHASIKRPLRAASPGTVSRIDAFKVGLASVVLGAGRSRKEDVVLPGVGISIRKSAGEAVSKGDELCLVSGEKEEKVQEALRLLASAWQLADGEPGPRQMIREEITQE